MLNQVTIEVDGISKFKLAGENPDDYPKHEFQGHVVELDEIDLQEMKASLKYVSTDELRPAMTGVYFGMHIAATNGHQLRSVKTKSHNNEEIIIPSGVIKLLDEKQSYMFSKEKEGYATFVAQTEKIIYRVIEERFPDFLNVIPAKETLVNSFEVDTAKMINMVELALITANASTKQLRLSITDKIKVHSEDLDFEHEYTESYELEAVQTEKDFEIGFHGDYLLTVLKDCKTDTVKFEMSESNRACLINTINLLMPVMLTSYNDASGIAR